MILVVTRPPLLPKKSLIKEGKVEEYALTETNNQPLLSSMPL